MVEHEAVVIVGRALGFFAGHVAEANVAHAIAACGDNGEEGSKGHAGNDGDHFGSGGDDLELQSDLGAAASDDAAEHASCCFWHLLGCAKQILERVAQALEVGTMVGRGEQKKAVDVVQGRVIAAPQVLDGAAADQPAHRVTDDANAAQPWSEGVVEFDDAVGEQRAILPDVLAGIVADHDGCPAQVFAHLVGERAAAEGPVLFVDEQAVDEECDVNRSGFSEDGC